MPYHAAAAGAAAATGPCAMRRQGLVLQPQRGYTETGYAGSYRAAGISGGGSSAVGVRLALVVAAVAVVAAAAPLPHARVVGVVEVGVAVI